MSNVELAEGARLLWREELICGRHGEQPGDATVSTSVTYAGKPLLRQALQVGPAAVHWAGPGVLGDHKATGCLLRRQYRILARGEPSRESCQCGNAGGDGSAGASR